MTESHERIVLSPHRLFIDRIVLSFEYKSLFLKKYPDALRIRGRSHRKIVFS
jgi:hypothetical protein